MPSFSKPLNSHGQFLIAVKITKSQVAESKDKNSVIANLVRSPIRRALIDTGATKTCISQECADDLGLFPVGMAEMQTAADTRQVDQYLIDFAIPVVKTALKESKKEDGSRSFETIPIGEENWAHIEHKVNALPPSGKGRGFDMLLGMDILSKMHITIFGGNIIMSF